MQAVTDAASYLYSWVPSFGWGKKEVWVELVEKHTQPLTPHDREYHQIRASYYEHLIQRLSASNSDALVHQAEKINLRIARKNLAHHREILRT